MAGARGRTSFSFAMSRADERKMMNNNLNRL